MKNAAIALDFQEHGRLARPFARSAVTLIALLFLCLSTLPSRAQNESFEAAKADYPFRMMWFTPLFGGAMVILVSLVAAAISARPVFKLHPGIVFAGR